jgi:membrane-associated phospholipid phosphatase
MESEGRSTRLERPLDDGQRQGPVTPAGPWRAASAGVTRVHPAVDMPPRQKSRRVSGQTPRTEAASKPANLRVLYLIQGAYLIALMAIFTIRGVGLTPDVILLLLGVGFVWRGNRWQFIRDFGPFVLLLLSYDALRGFADDFGGRVHFGYPITIDKTIFFGHLPTAVLQGWLFDPNSPRWYDYMAALMHILHFMVPLFFAAIIWQHHRRHYWPFVISLLLTSYAAFVTFLLVPTAPPWLAALKGDVSGVHLVHEGLPAVASIYNTLSPNPVAAMPSLHAAYPWLFLLFAWRIWGWRATPFALYPAAMFFSVVYLGHHYVADLLGGVIYGSAAYFVVCSPAVRRLVRAVPSLASRLRDHTAIEGDAVSAEGVVAGTPVDGRREAA